MALKPGTGLARWEIAVATKLVNEQRKRSRALQIDDVDDLVQECLVHWLTVRARLGHDPDNPPLGYMARVLRNWLTDLVRERSTDKRAGDLDLEPLDAVMDGSEDGVTLADTMHVVVDGSPDVDGIAHHHLRRDLLRTCVHLSASQQRLCLLIADEGLSVKAAAERLGIPRSTIYEEINRIRRIFAEHGLEIYLRG